MRLVLTAGAVLVAATALPPVIAVAARGKLQAQIVLGSEHKKGVSEDPFAALHQENDDDDDVYFPDNFLSTVWESAFPGSESDEEDEVCEFPEELDCGCGDWDEPPGEPADHKTTFSFEYDEPDTVTYKEWKDKVLKGEELPKMPKFPWKGRRPGSHHPPGPPDHEHPEPPHFGEPPKKPGHGKPPGHGKKPPCHGKPPGHGKKPPGHGKKPPCHGKPPGHHFPPFHPHPPHHIKTNLTIYEMISKSKYTTKLFEIIKNDTELVKALNSTSGNGITFFAPTDKAFDRIPGHGKPPHDPHKDDGDDDDKPKHPHHPSPEFIKAVLRYHLIPDQKVSYKELLFNFKTLPTALKSHDDKFLPKDTPQRIRISSSVFSGVQINFFAKVIAGDIEGTNGIVHAVDHWLIPFPPAQISLQFLPTRFSQFLYAVLKTGIEIPEDGKTVFPPPNSAWARLGYRINAFLFSKWGSKYLEALVKYHIAPKNVLYSDYYLKVENDDMEKPYFHIDLPTMLEDKSISIDITRAGPKNKWVKWKVNGDTGIVVRDVVVADGVIQVPFRVLVPPHKHSGEKKMGLTEKQEEALKEFEGWKAREAMGGWGSGGWDVFARGDEMGFIGDEMRFIDDKMDFIGDMGMEKGEHMTLEEFAERLLPYIQ